jgi:hypothetical protein
MRVTPTTALWQAFASVGTAIAGRSCEITNLCFKDVKRVVDKDGVTAFQISFDRAKKQTSNTTVREVAILKCPLGVAALERYFSPH